MYVDFENIQSLINNFGNTLNCLEEAREKIEYLIKRLNNSHEYEDVIAKMKVTVNNLNYKIVTVKKLKASLIKISEIHIHTEKKVIEKIEGGRITNKTEYSYFDDFPDLQLKVHSDVGEMIK